MQTSALPSLRTLLLWALLIFALTSVVGLGARPLAVPDEARYGAIPSEMLQSGDWISLKLGGFRWLEKPPLSMWMIAASEWAFGENAFAIRLPSALSSLLAAACVGWAAARITGRPKVGPLAFAVQATMIGPVVFGTVAITDPAFTAFLTLTMTAFLGACTSAGRKRIGWLAFTGVAAGLAFLCKGFLAFALPGFAALLYLLVQRRFRDLLTMPWVPLACAAALITPWAIAIHRREPHFWDFFINVVHLRRAMKPDGIQHPEPWWLYVVLLPALGLFWTLLWPKAFAHMGRVRAWKDGVHFALAWLLGPLLALSASSGKLPTYMLPLFPPLSLLITLGLVQAFEGGALRAGRVELFANLLLRAAAVVAVALALFGQGWLGIPALWSEHPSVRWGVLALALAAWSRVDVWSWRAPNVESWLLRTASAPVLVLACIPFLLPDALLQVSRHPWPLLEAHRSELQSSTTVISNSPFAHAVIWMTDRRDLLITGWWGEFDNQIDLPDDRARLVPPSNLGATIEARLAATPQASVTLVTSPGDADVLLSSHPLPAPAVREDRGDVAVLVWRAP